MLIITVAVGDEQVSEKQTLTRVAVTIHAGDVVAKLAKHTARKEFKTRFSKAKLAQIEVIVIPFDVIEAEFMNVLANSLGESITEKLTKADAQMKGEKLQ